eukprot:COSAG01_NODE_21617_length_893_cov_1.646096_2_plen_151_part_01
MLDATIAYGYTAYMVACQLGNLAAVQLLVKRGCDTTLCSTFGKTGLDLAADCQHTAVCNWLEDHAKEHAGLRVELLRRKLRPDVDSSRDELEVPANRLRFWTMPEQEYDNWARLGGGAFGDIYQVDSVFPPLTVQGGEAPVSTVVVKAVVG